MRIMTEYSESDEPAGVCFCPICTAQRVVNMHTAAGYGANDLLESLAYAVIMVLVAAPDNYRAELMEEILDGIHDSVHFNTASPTDTDVVH